MTRKFEDIYVIAFRVLQRPQLAPRVIRCHFDVVSAPPPEHDSEEFHVIFASDFDSAPVPHPHSVYYEPPQLAVIDSHVNWAVCELSEV